MTPTVTILVALIGALGPVALLVIGFLLNRVKTKLTVIETKVDGRLSKAVDDLAEANRNITVLTAGWVDFQAKADKFLQTGQGAAALQHAISLPPPSSAAAVVKKP